jgi:hypothetical protein
VGAETLPPTDGTTPGGSSSSPLGIVYVLFALAVAVLLATRPTAARARRTKR